MSVIQETIDDFCEFVDELVELMQEDWERVKKFVKEYKNYVFWFIVLSITMQITDIGTLGMYVKRMCEEEGIVQRGGDPPPPPPPPPPLQPLVIKSGAPKGNLLKNITKLEGVSPSSIKNAGSDIREARKIQREKNQEARAEARDKEKEAKQDAKDKENEAKQDARDKQAELKQLAQNMDSGEQGKAQGQPPDDELKKTEKQLSFFQRMKQKVSGVDAQGKRIGALGPVFGSMDKAMDYMQNIFAVLTFILTAIGIISLPVFIFLIITYFVIKSIASKIFIL